MFAGCIVAVSEPELMTTVGNGEPFQYTMDDETKFDPITVSVNDVPLASNVVGEIACMTGFGFGVGILFYLVN
jgi:hypothetical protein